MGNDFTLNHSDFYQQNNNHISLENKISLQTIDIAAFVTFFEIGPTVRIFIFSYHLFNKVPITSPIQTEMSTEKKVMKKLIIKANIYAIIIYCKPTLFKCEKFSRDLLELCHREYYSPRTSHQMYLVNYFLD